jgi:radical SAM protein with 4Fe4S-binding SPASM domain
MKEISYLSSPIHIWWDITQQCNFHCKHCYSGSKFKVEDELSTQEIIRIIEQLKESRICYVYILGGEPFIRPDFDVILREFSEQEIPLMINTNGWFINEEWADILSRSSVQHLRFSLDGAFSTTHDEFRGMTGSFDRVIHAIKLCRDARIPKISCSYTITTQNIGEIEQTCELLAQLGIDSVQFSPMASIGRASEHPELSLREGDTPEINRILGRSIEEYGDRIHIYSVDGTYDRPFTRLVKMGLIMPDFMGCQAGRTCCCIDWKGDVIPCLLWREKIAGSLRTHSFREIWGDSIIFKQLRKPRGEEYVECKKCIYSDVCARECPMSHSQLEYTAEERMSRIGEMCNKTQDNHPCLYVLEQCGIR